MRRRQAKHPFQAPDKGVHGRGVTQYETRRRGKRLLQLTNPSYKAIPPKENRRDQMSACSRSDSANEAVHVPPPSVVQRRGRWRGIGAPPAERSRERRRPRASRPKAASSGRALGHTPLVARCHVQGRPSGRGTDRPTGAPTDRGCSGKGWGTDEEARSQKKPRRRLARQERILLLRGRDMLQHLTETGTGLRQRLRGCDRSASQQAAAT